MIIAYCSANIRIFTNRELYSNISYDISFNRAVTQDVSSSGIVLILHSYRENRVNGEIQVFLETSDLWLVALIFNSWNYSLYTMDSIGSGWYERIGWN